MLKTYTMGVEPRHSRLFVRNLGAILTIVSSRPDPSQVTYRWISANFESKSDLLYQIQANWSLKSPSGTVVLRQIDHHTSFFSC